MSKPPSLRSTVSSRSGGRKIDTWKLRMEQPERTAKPLEIEFEVSLLSNMEFVVHTDAIAKDRWQPLQGKVLTELHKQAEEAAHAEFNLRLGLQWSTWLEVRVQQVSSYDLRKSEEGASAQAHLSYSAIPRGETPDGRAYTVSQNSGVLVPFPNDVMALPQGQDTRRKREEDPEKLAQMGERERLRFQFGNMDHREPNTQFTYLPDTPENRAGLDAIIHGIDTVNLRLQQFLHPAEINRTLARAAQAGPALLTGPAPEETPRPKGPGR